MASGWDDTDTSGSEYTSDSGGGSAGDMAALRGQEPPEFYDPEGDDKAAAWVAKLRGGRRSDAILSCPQCFTTVCVECQQHATRDNQFRAMFVMNCRINPDAEVSFSEPNHATPSTSGRKRRQDEGDTGDTSLTGTAEASGTPGFTPVSCKVCDYCVGYRSVQDGVYHFTDVLASEG